MAGHGDLARPAERPPYYNKVAAEVLSGDNRLLLLVKHLGQHGQ